MPQLGKVVLIPSDQKKTSHCYSSRLSTLNKFLELKSSVKFLVKQKVTEIASRCGRQPKTSPKF